MGKISEAYAQGASGRVRSVIGQDLRPGNIWEGYEKDALIKNPNVTQIETIDPVTGKREIIHSKGCQSLITMEILDIQRSQILVRVDDRTAKIEGEGFSRQLIQPGQDASKYVDFVVYADTLKWEKTWGSEPLPAAVKASILAFLKDDFTRRGQSLAVE